MAARSCAMAADEAATRDATNIARFMLPPFAARRVKALDLEIVTVRRKRLQRDAGARLLPSLGFRVLRGGLLFRWRYHFVCRVNCRRHRVEHFHIVAWHLLVHFAPQPQHDLGPIVE